MKRIFIRNDIFSRVGLFGFSFSSGFCNGRQDSWILLMELFLLQSFQKSLLKGWHSRKEIQTGIGKFEWECLFQAHWKKSFSHHNKFQARKKRSSGAGRSCRTGKTQKRMVTSLECWLKLTCLQKLSYNVFI